MSGTGSRLSFNLSNPLNICTIYEADSASLEAAGSKVYGAVLLKVKTPLPEEVGEEVVFDRIGLQLLKTPPENNISANNKCNNFFKADLPFRSDIFPIDGVLRLYSDFQTGIILTD